VIFQFQACFDIRTPFQWVFKGVVNLTAFNARFSNVGGSYYYARKSYYAILRDLFYV
jgi:hypothetical protein